ncbi:YjbH domain-containing protein [Ignavibacteria bacterium 4148-Me]|uniref:YjbH domain-containing protein n=1 Tax=Rosettibacter primus TaxID=3111523 RepID=UPI00336BDC5F
MKIFLLVIFFTSNILSQTIAGFSGLVTIPTGNLYSDGTLNFSFNYLNKKYVSFGNYNEDALVYSATLAFLPFIEINTNFVYLIRHKGTQGIGDRSVGFRLKLMNENKHFLSISTGLNNIGTAFGGVGAIHKQSIYIVASKSYSINDELFVMGTLGHGFRGFKAADYQFIGLFGGVSFTAFKNFELLVENDAERFNGAVRLTLFKHIKVLAGLMNFKDFSGGMAFSFVL